MNKNMLHFILFVSFIVAGTSYYDIKLKKKKNSTVKIQTNYIYHSFGEAQKLIRDKSGYQLEEANWFLLTNPMMLQGTIFGFRLKTMQTLNKREFLLISPAAPSDNELKIYHGSMFELSDQTIDLCDDEMVDIIGEVKGTYQYINTMGAVKTIPNIIIYGIKPE